MASPELPYFTCRLQRLPLDLDTEGLRETIPLEHGERVLFSSLSIDHYAMDESVKTATITWNVIPQYIRQLNLKDHDTLKLRSSNPFPQQSQPESIARLANATIDKHLTGLTPLNATSIEEAEDRVL